jgi:fructokinase
MKNETITVFGEVLFDQFPDGSSILGGAPFNVAWHLQAFGRNPQFISRVGADSAGSQIRTAMQSWGMSLDFLQQDAVYPTGQVQVRLEHGEPSFSILPDQAYDYIERQGLENIDHSGILYHGTLAVRSATSRQSIRFLKELHQGKIFIDVNLRRPWWNKNDVLEFIKDADWVKLNIHELQALQADSTNLKSCMGKLLSRYNLEGIIVTCGEKGAVALDQHGEYSSVAPPATTGDVVDTVGAGDAFCAIFLLGLSLGWPLAETMEKAQVFASALIKGQGATVNDLDFYLPFIKAWGL